MKLIEFFLPLNSNAKNRITVFLWFLVCFTVAFVLIFLNGYYFGRSQYEMLKVDYENDSVNLHRKIDTLEKGKFYLMNLKNDVDYWSRFCSYDLSAKIAESNSGNTEELYRPILNAIKRSDHQNDSNFQRILLVFRASIEKSINDNNITDTTNTEENPADAQLIAEKKEELDKKVAENSKKQNEIEGLKAQISNLILQIESLNRDHGLQNKDLNTQIELLKNETGYMKLVKDINASELPPKKKKSLTDRLKKLLRDAGII